MPVDSYLYFYLTILDTVVRILEIKVLLKCAT